MQLTELQLTNIRCFGEGESSLRLQLQQPDGSIPRWVVLAGPNGSGKTSVLQSISVLVIGLNAISAFYPEVSSLAREDQTKLAAEGKLIFCTIDGKIKKQQEDIIGGFESSPDIVLHVYPGRYGIGASNEDMQPETLWGEPRQGLFAVGYGPFRRFTSGGIANTNPTNRIASFAGIFREEDSRYDSISWLKEVHLRKLENKADFAALEDGLLRLLGDGLLPLGVKPIRVDSDGLWVSMHGKEFSLQRLSDGYQTTAAFVIDLVMRLRATFQEKFTIEERDGKTIIPHSGIVLVDEMEEHLHPAWQQKIGFWLKDHFPGLQFIVSTHSPFICQAADPGGLIRLAAPGETPAAKSIDGALYRRVIYGGIDDAVVTELFGLPFPHSERAEQLREEVATLEAKEIEEAITPEEQTTLDSLREQLPNTPSIAIEQALRRLQQENQHHETNQEIEAE